MRIFVAYGYRAADSWISELVFPLITAFGNDVVTGEQLEGEQIPPEVRNRIAGCDALMAFLTRRDPIGDDAFTTHRWVIEELALALQSGLKVLEVRETGVDAQRGIMQDRQYIEYDGADRDRLLVQLVTTLGRWSQDSDMKLQLIPETVAEQIRPLLSRPGFSCEYTVMDQGRRQLPQRTEIVELTGGLFAYLRLPRGSMVSVRVMATGYSWTSPFVALDAIQVPLRPETVP
jgi:hypothetical protein